jgi:protein SCO1/2
MRPYAKHCVVALGLAALAAPGASAHSLKDLETMLGSREKYFQPVDKTAPDFSLQDAHGREVRLADLRGRVVVLHFVYAGCPDVCPLHADLVAEVQSMVNRTPMRDQVQFLSVTTDPDRDTPEVLRDYGPSHGLDTGNWTFLTTRPGQPEDATRRLAEAFGHKFEKAEDGYQIHGVVTHVIDREGRWRANFHGLRFEPTNLVVLVNALVNDVHPPRGQAERSLWDKMKALVR